MSFFENKKFTIATISILVVLNLVLISFLTIPELKNNRSKDRYRTYDHAAYLAKKLEFTEAQTAELREVMSGHRTELNAVKKEMNAKRSELYAKLREPQDDSVSIEELTGEIGFLAGQIEQINFDYFMNVRALCSPEQLDKLDQLMRRMMKSRSSPSTPQKGRK